MYRHILKGTAYIGGADSRYPSGQRRPIACCSLFPCKIARKDDMTLINLDGPDEPIPIDCPGAAAQAAAVAAAAAAAAAATAAAPPTSPKRRRDEEEDDKDADFQLGDPLHRLCRQVLDLPRVSRLIKTGDLSWIGDPAMFPASANPDATGGPFEIWHNLCVYDQILAIRMLALVLEKAGPQDLRDDLLAEEAEEKDINWTDVVGSNAATHLFTPRDCVEASLCLQLTAIGRKARAHRTKRKLTVHHIGESEIQIRDAKAAGDFVDWLSFKCAQEAWNGCERIAASMHAGPTRITIADCEENDEDFILGCFIVEMGMNREIACRTAWRAVDVQEALTRKRLGKEHADDVKCWKTKVKAGTSSSRGGRRAGAGTGAGGGGGNDGGGYGAGHTSWAAGAATAAGAAAAAGGSGGSGGGRGGRGAPGGGRGAPGGGRAPPGAGNRRDKAQVQAAPPAKRSNTECRRFGLCLNCRDSSDHPKATCTAQAVQYNP